jgi:hypothetical protein
MGNKEQVFILKEKEGIKSKLTLTPQKVAAASTQTAIPYQKQEYRLHQTSAGATTTLTHTAVGTAGIIGVETAATVAQAARSEVCLQSPASREDGSSRSMS